MYIKRSDAIKGKMAGTANASAEFLMGMDERERRIFSLGYADGWNEHIDKCKYDIPSAEKQGEWIYHKELILDNEYYPSRFECDQCHHFVVAGSDRNFCPNCGCDMRKGADDVQRSTKTDSRNV